MKLDLHFRFILILKYSLIKYLNISRIYYLSKQFGILKVGNIVYYIR